MISYKYYYILFPLLACSSPMEVASNHSNDVGYAHIVPTFSTELDASVLDGSAPISYDSCVPRHIMIDPNDLGNSSANFVNECPAIIHNPPKWIPPWDPSPIEK